MWRVEVTWQGWVYVEAPDEDDACILAASMVETALSDHAGEALGTCAEGVEEE